MSAPDEPEDLVPDSKAGAPEKRRHSRLSGYGPQELRVTRSGGSGAEQTIRAILWDFSPGGLGTDSPRALPVGEVVTISGELRGPDFSMEIEAQARVVYCRKIDKELYRVGFAFLDVSYRPLRRDEG